LLPRFTPAYSSPMNDVLKAPSDPTLFWGLVHLGQDLAEEVERALEPVGLSGAKLKVLTLLVQSDRPMALRELAEGSRCVRSNVTQLVDRLEAEGFVKRTTDPDDRRSILAVLTPAGREKQAKGMALQRTRETACLKQLGIDDRATLLELIAQLKR
jgi:DNA-binding MarR family transcriptional regulator